MSPSKAPFHIIFSDNEDDEPLVPIFTSRKSTTDKLTPIYLTKRHIKHPPLFQTPPPTISKKKKKNKTIPARPLPNTQLSQNTASASQIVGQIPSTQLPLQKSSNRVTSTTARNREKKNSESTNSFHRPSQTTKSSVSPTSAGHTPPAVEKNKSNKRNNNNTNKAHVTKQVNQLPHQQPLLPTVQAARPRPHASKKGKEKKTNHAQPCNPIAVQPSPKQQPSKLSTPKRKKKSNKARYQNNIKPNTPKSQPNPPHSFQNSPNVTKQRPQPPQGGAPPFDQPHTPSTAAKKKTTREATIPGHATPKHQLSQAGESRPQQNPGMPGTGPERTSVARAGNSDLCEPNKRTLGKRSAQQAFPQPQSTQFGSKTAKTKKKARKLRNASKTATVSSTANHVAPNDSTLHLTQAHMAPNSSREAPLNSRLNHTGRSDSTIKVVRGLVTEIKNRRVYEAPTNDWTVCPKPAKPSSSSHSVRDHIANVPFSQKTPPPPINSKQRQQAHAVTDSRGTPKRKPPPKLFDNRHGAGSQKTRSQTENTSSPRNQPPTRNDVAVSEHGLSSRQDQRYSSGSKRKRPSRGHDGLPAPHMDSLPKRKKLDHGYGSQASRGSSMPLKTRTQTNRSQLVQASVCEHQIPQRRPPRQTSRNVQSRQEFSSPRMVPQTSQVGSFRRAPQEHIKKQEGCGTTETCRRAPQHCLRTSNTTSDRPSVTRPSLHPQLPANRSERERGFQVSERERGRVHSGDDVYQFQERSGRTLRPLLPSEPASQEPVQTAPIGPVERSCGAGQNSLKQSRCEVVKRQVMQANLSPTPNKFGTPQVERQSHYQRHDISETLTPSDPPSSGYHRFDPPGTGLDDRSMRLQPSNSQENGRSAASQRVSRSPSLLGANSHSHNQVSRTPEGGRHGSEKRGRRKSRQRKTISRTGEYYGIRYGREGFSGVTTCWNSCSVFVLGYSDAVYAMFNTWEKAEEFADRDGTGASLNYRSNYRHFFGLWRNGCWMEGSIAQLPWELENEPKVISLVTSGAWLRFGMGTGIGGYGVFLSEHSPYNFGGLMEGNVSESRVHLKAVLEALEIVHQHGLVGDRGVVELYTPSQDVKNGIDHWLGKWQRSGRWERRGNAVHSQDLWKAILAIREVLDKRKTRIQMICVRAPGKVRAVQEATTLARSAFKHLVGSK